ncbi:hypothetical protein QJQ45_013036 [Haematococcus lacustris]|nr:hypothetical protein QJQ45_013036 [Haematococcus lacustris]
MLHSPAKVVIRTWRSLHTCGCVTADSSVAHNPYASMSPALADTGISPRGRPGPEAQADTVQEVKDKAKSAAADPAGTLASLGSAVKDAAVWTAQFAKVLQQPDPGCREETVTTVAGLGGQVLGNTRDDVLKEVAAARQPDHANAARTETGGAGAAGAASQSAQPGAIGADFGRSPDQAQDQVTSARFYAIKQVAQDVDSLSDAQMEFAAHASSVLASLGLDQAAQQLRQSNAAAAEKLAAVKQQQAGLDLSGLLEDRLPGLLSGEGSSSAEGEAAG